MLAKLFLVLVYFVIVFLTTRILEISSTWLGAGCLASQLLDPFALSVKKLKSILEHRGVSYTGVVEKKELVVLVDVSGNFSEAEQCSITRQNAVDDAVENEECIFTGTSHFFEEVEDTKAGSWLVEVVPGGHSPLLRRTQWEKLKRRIVRFGIRTGTFNCENDPGLCLKYKWEKPSLVLSMPQGNHPKGNVMLKTYDARPSADLVFNWINAKLASKIITLDSLENFKSSFAAELELNNVYVVLLSAMPPPLYLSTLSVHFTGRVRFGHVSVPNWQLQRQLLNEFNIHRVPSLMIFTPERSFTYGDRMGEHLDYRTLDLLLKTLHPEVNDLFVGVLAVVNLSCVLELFLIQGGLLKRTFRFTCLLVFYNTSLIILCLPVVGLFKFSLLDPVLQLGLQVCRYMMTSSLASVLRSDFLLCMEHKGLAFVGYVLFGLVIGWMRRRYKCYFDAVGEDFEESTADWITQDLNYFNHVFQTFPSLWRPQIEYSGLEDGIEWLVRRLAIPDLWLHPLVPTDYIRSLPSWKFCCGKKSCLQNTQEEKSAKMYGETRNCCKDSQKPVEMIVCQECSICLEVFDHGCFLLGLPCGHSFHQHCIELWLYGGNTSGHHCCPICRWPAYKFKPKTGNIHLST